MFFYGCNEDQGVADAQNASESAGAEEVTSQQQSGGFWNWLKGAGNAAKKDAGKAAKALTGGVADNTIDYLTGATTGENDASQAEQKTSDLVDVTKTAIENIQPGQTVTVQGGDITVTVERASE